ncbi:hypothetical protein NDU88_012013 [Pleurodeles waltl]|uniref:Uncharacterized protein n=1 Tax=Pleurodeles waltl TaxID=8319 RepID=A0AAV7S3G1_PLEWA|nr:hypothetical protein NDU88_012013 [Pleurodeles waltl]
MGPIPFVTPGVKGFTRWPASREGSQSDRYNARLTPSVPFTGGAEWPPKGSLVLCRQGSCEGHQTSILPEHWDCSRADTSQTLSLAQEGSASVTLPSWCSTRRYESRLMSCTLRKGSFAIANTDSQAELQLMRLVKRCVCHTPALCPWRLERCQELNRTALTGCPCG